MRCRGTQPRHASAAPIRTFHRLFQKCFPLRILADTVDAFFAIHLRVHGFPLASRCPLDREQRVIWQ
jgi:hypothetical protein